MFVGLDRLASLPDLVRELRGAKVGLLAHPASVDRNLAHASEVFLALGVRPRMFFGPEHGYGGEAQDMIGVDAAIDARTGAPIVSLYGDAFEDLSPKPEHLAEIDVLVIDLADVGARYYTFVWTALLAVRAAAKAGVRSIVLDRPNPLGATQIEGRSQEPGFLSFVGLERAPIRHAMTIGEIVATFASERGVAMGDALRFVEAIGVADEDHAPRWDRPFVMPSPNMPSYETALVYPGGCLLEGTNLSEGRGTTRPFEIVGAPWIDGRALAQSLHATGLSGFVARPITFQPTFHKFAKEQCGGVFVHVTDARAFRPVATYAALVAIARAQDPDRFRFRTERYEFIDTIPAYDLLTGSARAREATIAGEDPREIAEALSSAADVEWKARIQSARALVKSARVST